MVSTKTADRRELRFGRLSDIERDVDLLDAAASIRNTGNWSPGQVLEHVTMFIEYSLDGFPFKAPALLRVLGPMMRDRVLLRPMKPGFKSPRTMHAAVPEADVSWERALSRFRKSMERIDGGDRMTHRSPVFGELNHEQWCQMHCRHAELHFSFLHPMNGKDAQREGN